MTGMRGLLLLGATGDLARRFLFPAIGTLNDAGRLPDEFRIVGAARDDLTDGVLDSVAGDELPTRMLTYRQIDVGDRESMASAISATPAPAAVYLALPPSVSETAIETIASVGSRSVRRIAVEKPFGDDLESAKKLNTLLARSATDAYRVDHVLGMETVHKLIAMRRDNPVLERLWCSESVHEVDILWEESLALEGRAGYYDRAGALADVVQSHMLQLLALVAMEPARREDDVPVGKLEVLNSVRWTGESRRARYGAGRLADGREVGAYADEAGVDPGRCTETFVEVVVHLDMPRWTGTRFVLRAGKALSRRRKLILLHFRGGGELEIGIDGPKDVVLRLGAAANRTLELRGGGFDEGLPAYAHILADILAGTNAFSVRAEEAEQAWRILEPVLASWNAGNVPLAEYRQAPRDLSSGSTAR